MNQEVLDMIASGQVPYRYEADTASALYFGLLILLIVFAYAIAEGLTRRFIG
ncbi:MAG: hypothetical protein L6Q97_08520 [Thermoanaerobaculia bacterium]|nr:hypothetical protein [Thermoanaerobaculia bacterium]